MPPIIRASPTVACANACKVGSITTITLLFYSALLNTTIIQTGSILPTPAINNLFTFIAGNGGGRNDALLNLQTLEVQQLYVLKQSHTNYKLILNTEPSAFAINWPTRQTGWNLIILDNESKGFSINTMKASTIIKK